MSNLSASYRNDVFATYLSAFNVSDARGSSRRLNRSVLSFRVRREGPTCSAKPKELPRTLKITRSPRKRDSAVARPPAHKRHRDPPLRTSTTRHHVACRPASYLDPRLHTRLARVRARARAARARLARHRFPRRRHIWTLDCAHTRPSDAWRRMIRSADSELASPTGVISIP